MEFIENVDIKEYKEFLDNCSYNHFLQSPEWGLIVEKNRKQKRCLVGLKDNGKLVAAGMLSKRSTPFHMCYYYASRGFILDYNNKVIQRSMEKTNKNSYKISLKRNSNKSV